MRYLQSLASAAAIVSVLSVACQASAAPLEAQSIMKLFPGQFEARFKSYKIRFSADRAGRMAGRSNGIVDRGQWYVRGNQLCVAWNLWTMGKPKCGAIWQRGKWYVASNSDGHTLAFRPLSRVAQN